jgi:hypothetical protein
MRNNFDALREAERLEKETETDANNKLSGLMMIDGMEYEDQPHHQSSQDRQKEPDEDLRTIMMSGGDYLNLDSIFVFLL